MNIKKFIGSFIPESVNDITQESIMPNGKMKLLSAAEYSKYSLDELRYFGHQNARYGYPTQELINFLKKIIGDRKTIEIGAGHGDLGFHLGIPMTDSQIQCREDVKEHYALIKQPIIKYPEDVKKFEAIEAIYRYKPKVVIGSWITTYSPYETFYNSSPYGVNEERLLSLVECYILIGNTDIHGDKPIMQYSHHKISGGFIMSRATHPENNTIWIWSKNGNNIERLS